MIFFLYLLQILILSSMTLGSDKFEKIKRKESIKRDLWRLEQLKLNEINLYFPDMKDNLDFHTNDVTMMQNENLFSLGNKKKDKEFILNNFFIYYQTKRMDIGSESIRRLGEDIVEKFNLTDVDVIEDVKTEVRNIIAKYLTKLNETIHITRNHKAKNNVELQYVILNMTEYDIQQLNKHLMILLDKVVLEEDDYKFKKQLKIMRKNLKPRKEHDRIQVVQMLCQELDFCRPCPGYSDYLLDYLEEIYDFKPNKLAQYVEKVVTAYNSLINETFLEKVIFKEDADKMKEWMKDLKNDPKKLKVLHKIIYTLMSTIFKKRHYPIQSNKVKFNKTVAARILLDMIDKAFESEDKDVLSMTFNANIGGMRKWGSGFRDEVSLLVKDLLHYTLQTVKFHWAPEIQAEAKTLVQIMLNGKSDSDESEYILTDGSKYLQGKVI